MPPYALNLSYHELLHLLRADLARHATEPSLKGFLRCVGGVIVHDHSVIGRDRAIGANCVVTKDVRENAVVGVPGRAISHAGAGESIGTTLDALGRRAAEPDPRREPGSPRERDAA